MPALPFNRKVSVAPMMDWTDRHCRYFHRLISPDIFLYTEMVTSPAIIHGDREKLLGFSEKEKPLALQLGGSNADELARCAGVGAEWGYDEINLNCGCPSDRVQSGSFGACLMAEPQTVAKCIAAMQREVNIPVTVKSRIGIDDFDNYDFLKKFVETVAATGCNIFIIHARKAILKGLSPRENREVPPLIYDYVYRIKQEFPQLHITLNGGVKTVDEIQTHLKHVDGVMIGRAAYQNPWLLDEIQTEIFQKPTGQTPQQVVEAMLAYADAHLVRGGKLSNVTRHMLGMFPGQRGARLWRQALTAGEVLEPGANSTVISKALRFINA
ncbi:MAG TPA: tRNA dihydrouridine(20/20a) synthase DusA [Alphaproteobacteria bacterium]|nr:tRNA dihydrouridine(20/20a) synthase DusA [Rhodospirillaceae bacterium]HRJ12210.1 tRNA dihydrouridine(20/20a) synthase DusA [Alphaproteobacteria bacterium]